MEKKVSLANSSVDELIADFATPGQTDSSGAFTISAEQAREKLSQFALFHARQYVLNVVASAVCGGASEIRVTTAPSKVTFNYDGEPLDEQHLQQLWSQLLGPSEPRLHELAMALNSARSLSPSQLSVESWWEGQLTRLDVRDDQLQVSSEPGEGSGIRVTVLESNWFMAMMWLFGSNESLFLKGVTYLGPAQLLLNGRDLSQKVTFGHSSGCAAWRHLVPRGQAAALRVDRPSPEVAPAGQVDEALDDDLEAVITLGSPVDCKGEGVLLLWHGIAVRRPSQALGYDFVSAVVVGKGLRKNLSHSDLVEDEGYLNLIRTVRHRAEDLLIERLDDPRSLPLGLSDALLAQSTPLLESLKERQLPQAVATVNRWLWETAFARDVLDEKLWQTLFEGLQILRSNNMALRLEASLRKAGDGFFQHGQAGRTVVCWQRLVQLGEWSQALWLEQERETLELLRALCGMASEPAPCFAGERRALVGRLLERPAEAMAEGLEPLGRAEAMLALGRDGEAEPVLREILNVEESPEAAEALADLLAFSHHLALRNRAEALRWRERALAWRHKEWADCWQILHCDLASLARAVSWSGWLSYQVHASRRNLTPELTEFEDKMEKLRLRIARLPLTAVSVKMLVLSAEGRWGPDHLFTRLTRLRAVHLLRQAGQWQEADTLVARGRLLQLISCSPAPG